MRSAESSRRRLDEIVPVSPGMGRQSDCHPKRNFVPLAPLRGYPLAGTSVPSYSFISMNLTDSVTATGLFLLHARKEDSYAVPRF